MHYKDLVAGYIRTPLEPIPTQTVPTGSLTGKVECVLFDVYGTLFISGSGDIHATGRKPHDDRGLKRLLKKYGIDLKPRIVRTELVNRIEATHQTLRKKGIDFPEIIIEKIWQDVLNVNLSVARSFAVEFELIVNPVYPMPGLRRLLGQCREAKLRMGIISNAQFYTPFLFDWFLEENLEDLGFDPDITLFSYQWGYAKPSPYLFQLAGERLIHKNIPAQAALFVGNDMLNDIRPARQAGFKTALFAGDARSLRLRKDHPRCKNTVPDLVITRLETLLERLP